MRLHCALCENLKLLKNKLKRMMPQKLKVVKTGGKLIDDENRLERFLKAFAQTEGPKILVHGGGSLASRISRRLGIEPQMVDGRRITSSVDIQVVAMVYAGWVNKKIVAALQSYGCPALGLSGADAGVILAEKRPVKEIDYGFVGDIKKVDGKKVKAFLEQGLVPVFSAITHDGKGQLLNTNSDTVAAEVAVAVSATFDTELMYCFEKQGVLRDSDNDQSVIPVLDEEAYREGRGQGWLNGGMLPKLHTGFDALKRGVSSVKIGNEKILENDRQIFTRLKL